MIRIGSTALMATSLIAGSAAFVTPTRVSPASQPMVLSAETTGFEQRPRRPIKDISYGEGSRKFRRTVYSHDDWKKHRSPDRFSYYISAFLNSGIYKNIQHEITAVTAIAALLCIYNAVFGGYTDFAGVDHPALLSSPYLVRAGLPMATFTLANSFLGLLLGKDMNKKTCLCKVLNDLNPLMPLFRCDLCSLPHEPILSTLGRST